METRKGAAETVSPSNADGGSTVTDGKAQEPKVGGGLALVLENDLERMAGAENVSDPQQAYEASA